MSFGSCPCGSARTASEADTALAVITRNTANTEIEIIRGMIGQNGTVMGVILSKLHWNRQAGKSSSTGRKLRPVFGEDRPTLMVTPATRDFKITTRKAFSSEASAFDQCN